MALLWLEFISCSAVIVYAGAKLSRYGDVIAEKAGLGRAWVGLILMASVTSLPEMMTGLSSVVLVDAPDIALGDIFGSCVFNLALISLMDILHGPGPIFSKAEQGHVLSAAFGVILIGFGVVSLLVCRQVPSLGHVGLYTPAIIVTYGIAIRSVFHFEKRRVAAFVGELAEATRYGDITKRAAIANYAVNAALVVAAAAWLPFIADRLSAETGLGRSFVGTALVAITTSLPELVVSIASLRIGATDMAIGNLFGSNLFNIFLLAVDDLAYVKGPILAHASPNHAVTGLMAMLMTGVTIAGLTYRLDKKTFLRLGWDAVALVSAFLANVYLQYVLRGNG